MEVHPSEMARQQPKKHMATITNKSAIVITGGPGMGKTSIVEHLIQMGYACQEESGRYIIQSQLRSGGKKLPWADRVGFADEMFRMAMHDYEKALDNKAITFFDRGIPDVIGYLALCGLPVPDEMWSAAETYRYHASVFITPPWKEIYVQDKERKQTFEESVATYDVMVDVYMKLGYLLSEIPKLPVHNRAGFIVSRVA